MKKFSAVTLYFAPKMVTTFVAAPETPSVLAPFTRTRYLQRRKC